MFYDNLLSLPSVERFIGDIHAKFTDKGYNRSLQILVTPPGMNNQALRHGFAERAYQNDYRYKSIDVSTFTELPKTPNSLAHVILHNNPGYIDHLEEALDEEEYPEILQLEGMDKITASSQVELISLVRSYIDQLQRLNLRTAGPRSLLLIESANILLDLLPTPDVGLNINYFWGYPSSLELRLLSRESTEQFSAETLWTEALLDGIAGGDPTIGQMMIDDTPDNVGDVMNLLREAAEVCGTGDSNPDPLPYKRVKRGNPSDRDFRLWAEGLTIASPEYGVEVHPCVLVKSRDEKTLEQRIWRGQAQFVLPLADRFRLHASSDLDHKFSTGKEKWFDLLTPPDTVEALKRLRANPLDAELGYLKTLSRRVSSPWTECVGLVQSCRNSVSHYQLLDKDKFTEFTKQATAVL